MNQGNEVTYAFALFIGILIGLVFGVSIGYCMKDVPFWACIGVCFGLTLGNGIAKIIINW